MVVNNKLRIIQVVCAIFWCLFAAGPIFGFAALKPILIEEKVYHEFCDGDKLCLAQDLKLNKMFTIGAVVTNATALLVGNILDHYGPRICGITGSILLLIGALLLSKTFPLVQYFDTYLSGYLFLALGGPFVFISSFQLANSFPKSSGMILALLTGAFDTSSAVFLVYRIIYQNIKKISIMSFFHIYLVIPVFIFLCQVFIMPQKSYKTFGTVQKLAIEGLDENGQLLEGDDGSNIIPDINERTSLLSNEERGLEPRTSLTANGKRRKSVYEEIVEQEITNKTGNIFGILDGYAVKDQIRSPFFYIMCGFTSIQMMRINYFVATVRSQEDFLLGPELALKINNIFDVALPLGGVVAIPFIGLLLDNLKTVQILMILLSTSLVIGICGLFQNFYLNLIGIFLLVVYRPFYYTTVSDYSAKIFGFNTFGQVYGLMMCTAGLINYTQTYLDLFTKTFYKSNPTPINMMLISLTVIFGSWLILYMKSQEKSIERKSLENEADRAPMSDIPE